MTQKTISGFTTTFNCYEMHYPFEECIRSLLGFCDEVSIADAGSTDGTIETLERLSREDSRVKFAIQPVDFNHPRWAIHQDGYLKAKARAGCTGDYCWQTDTDEIVAPEDYDKCRRLPDFLKALDAQLTMLPMIEYWGSLDYIRGDFFSWKPRFSVNDKRITHGIPKDLKCFDENGYEYPRPYDSDSCNYIYKDTQESVRIVIPVEQEILRTTALGTAEYQRLFYKWLDELPSVHHISWLDLGRKVDHYRKFWRKFHASMYNLKSPDTAENNVMFDKPWSEVTDADIAAKAEQLKNLGPRFFHKKMDTVRRGIVIPFRRPVPELLLSWLRKEKEREAVPAPAQPSAGRQQVSPLTLLV